MNFATTQAGIVLETTQKYRFRSEKAALSQYFRRFCDGQKSSAVNIFGYRHWGPSVRCSTFSSSKKPKNQ